MDVSIIDTRSPGLHLIGTLIECDIDILTHYDEIYKFIDLFPTKIQMKKINFKGNPCLQSCKSTDDPNNYGLSGFVMLIESHFSVHCWPHYGSVDFDIFSCKHFDYEFAINELTTFFKGELVNSILTNRGNHQNHYLKLST